MKEKYERPEMEIIEIDAQDIIRTSAICPANICTIDNEFCTTNVCIRYEEEEVE